MPPVKAEPSTDAIVSEALDPKSSRDWFILGDESAPERILKLKRAIVEMEAATEPDADAIARPRPRSMPSKRRTAAFKSVS